MMKDSASRRMFRDAGLLYMLRSLLSTSCHNLHGKSFRDEVAELNVTEDLRPHKGPKPRTGTWMHAIPIRDHPWPSCAVLLLGASEEDARPNPPLRTAVEVPPNRILLSATKLYDAASGKLPHWSLSSSRLLLLIPAEEADGEYVPTVVRSMELSEDGAGSRMMLDLVIIDDLDAIAQYYGPPYYGFANP